MSVEVGQVRKYGWSKSYLVVTASYEPTRSLVEILHDGGFTSDEVPIEDIQKGTILISSHADMYAAIAEMGRLVAAKGGES